MELARYLDILRRRLYVILLVTSVAIMVVVVTEYFTEPVYQAYTTVRVMEDVGVQAFNIIRDGYGERLTNTYGAIVRSRSILETANAQLGVSIPLNELREAIDIEVVPGTELMSISVTNQDPYLAQDMANRLAILLVDHVHDLYTGDNAGSRQIEERLLTLEKELEQDRQKLAGLMLDYSVPEAEIEILQNTIEFKEDSYRNMLLLYDTTRLNEDLRARSVMIVTPAPLPTVPANSIGLQQVVLGIIVGLFSGLGLALVLENLDTRIYSIQQLESLTSLPVLGVVPRGLLSSTVLGVDKDRYLQETYRLLEAYRLLTINLQKFREDLFTQTIMVTSAVSGEGKSTVTVNLSTTLAERGQTVFLIEADMRHPSLSRKLGLTKNGQGSTSEGLSDLLSDPGVIDEYKLSQVLNLTDQPTLFFVEGGTKVANPTALLASPKMDQLLKYLGAQGQTTLIDTTPILGVADVSVVASKVDGVVLVVSQGISEREEVMAAIKQLKIADSHILGLIFIQKNGEEKAYY